MGWLKNFYKITIVQVQNSSLKFEYETQVSEILCIKIFINKLKNRSREFGTHEKIRKKFAKIHD